MVEPSDDATVRTRLSQFGNDSGIQEVPVHLNSVTVRRRSLRRSGIKFSKRASGANNKALRPGRAALCRRFHSSIGTRTAVSIPRRVTTWGPFLMVASKNSLNRAFASCTCHEPMPNLLVRETPIIQTSHMTSQYTKKDRRLIGRLHVLPTPKCQSTSVGDPWSQIWHTAGTPKGQSSSSLLS